MTKPCSTFRRLMPCVVLIAIFATEMLASAQANWGDSATVLHVHGKARVSPDRKSWQTLKKSAVIAEGAMLQTAGRSSVDLRLGPEGTLQVLRDSVLGFDRLTGLNSTADVELDLREGGIEGRVGKLPAGSHYEVKFINGVVGPRSGAVFRMTAAGTVSVPSGEVIVVTISSDGTPKTQAVRAGQQYNVATGALTEIPREKRPDPRSEFENPPGPSPEPRGPTPSAPLRKF